MHWTGRREVWRRPGPLLLVLLTAPSFAQEPEPAPDPELLEFLGDWQPGEEVVLDDETGAVPIPAVGKDQR